MQLTYPLSYGAAKIRVSLKNRIANGAKKTPVLPVPVRGGEGGRAASADAAGHAEGGGDGAQDAEQRLQDEFPGLFLFHGAWV